MSAKFRLWRFIKVGDGKYIEPILLTEKTAEGKDKTYFYQDLEVESQITYAYRLSEIETDGNEVFYLDKSAEATTQ